MNIASAMDKVRKFHAKMGFTIGDARNVPPNVRPYHASAENKLLRARLVTEEAAELVAAIQEDDMDGLADAIADLLYVVLGTAVVYDLPAEAAFDEVHMSNMTKDSPNEHGKGGKGRGFVPPDMHAVLWAHSRGLKTGGRHHCGGTMIESAPGEYYECSLCG